MEMLKYETNMSKNFHRNLVIFIEILMGKNSSILTKLWDFENIPIFLILIKIVTTLSGSPSYLIKSSDACI